MKEELGSEKLIGALFLASRQMRQKATRDFAEYGVTFEQLEILFLLKHKDEMSISQVAHKLEKDKATISRSIRFLELRGLVQKKLNITDKRKLKITLSNEGRAKLEEVYICHHNLVEVLDHTVNLEEQKIFLQILRKIVDIFCEDNNPCWQKMDNQNFIQKDLDGGGG